MRVFVGEMFALFFKSRFNYLGFWGVTENNSSILTNIEGV